MTLLDDDAVSISFLRLHFFDIFIKVVSFLEAFFYYFYENCAKYTEASFLKKFFFFRFLSLASFNRRDMYISYLFILLATLITVLTSSPTFILSPIQTPLPTRLKLSDL